MKDLQKNCKIALVQQEPILFDRRACVEKAVAAIREAAREGAEFIVFPELFVPGYPFGMTFGFVVGARGEEGREDWKRYYDQSILVPGPETDILGEAAREAKAYVSIGVSQRDETTASLYNSNIIFSPDGSIASVHRKLKPTGSERVVWSDGNKGFFPMVDTPWGNAASLICWESYMPLARVALYEKGVTLYISPNTNDNEEWQATIRHIAIEGHCYFINSNLFFRKDSYPPDLATAHEVEALPDLVCRGGSCIVDPYGHYVTEPVWDREAIIYAELDMDKVVASRMEFDPCGHYARPDVLSLKVRDE
jgi:nitrilase